MSQSEQNWPRKTDFSIFSILVIFDFLSSILGAKISNRRNTVGMSKNYDFLKIEFIHILQSKSYGESIAKLKKMIGTLENKVLITF